MTAPWERQPNERLQTYIYKTIYIKHLKKANKHLEDVITYIKKLPKNNNESHTRLFQGILIEIPTMQVLYNASKKWGWIQADEEYTNYLSELDQEKREQNYDNSVDQVDNIIDDMFDLVEGSVKDLKESEYKPSTKIQLEYTLARTIDLLKKNKNLNHNRPTSISKSDVEVDANVEFDGFDNLIEAFHASKKQWDKHKQQK